MTDLMSPEALRRAKAHALAEYPKESCGLLVDGAYVECFNYAVDPEKDFVIADQVYLEHQDRIQAVIHSHPNGPLFPSEADMRGQISSNVTWIILPTDGENVGAPIAWGDAVPKQPLIGRSFIHGIQDCYSLVRDYYKEVHNIELDEIPRNDNWWEGDQDLYMDHFKSQGFRVIDVSDIKPGDGFLSAIRSDKCNHAGILVENDLILHHLPTRLSRREPAGLWLRAVKFWLRHKDLNNA